MEVKILSKFCGAWTDKGQAPFMRLAIKAEYDFSKVSSRIRTPIIKGLRTGVLSTATGQSASVFRVISTVFNLKYVCASKTGGQMYTNFNDDKFYEACIALYGLTAERVSFGVHRYINRNKRGITCWSWAAKDEATRNIFFEVFGLEDKDLREKAIDFLCTGGKLEQTWVDKNPI